MTKKKVQGITYTEDGMMLINPNVDAANSDPIRAARLKQSDRLEDQERLKELESTPMFKQKKSKHPSEEYSTS